jgi:hypothetical protein
MNYWQGVSRGWRLMKRSKFPVNDITGNNRRKREGAKTCRNPQPFRDLNGNKVRQRWKINTGKSKAIVS